MRSTSGANVNAATKYGVTALMKMAVHDRTGAAQQLRICGAEGSLRACDGLLTAKGQAGERCGSRSPVHFMWVAHWNCVRKMFCSCSQGG